MSISPGTSPNRSLSSRRNTYSRRLHLRSQLCHRNSNSVTSQGAGWLKPTDWRASGLLRESIDFGRGAKESVTATEISVLARQADARTAVFRLQLSSEFEAAGHKNMKKSDWKETAELIGAIAIVGSLLFVGFQLAQDRRIAQAELAIDYEMKQTELSSFISQNSELWRKGLSGEELTSAEEVVFETIVHAVMVKYDAMFDRAENKFGTRTSDGIPRQFAMHIYSHPGFRSVWERRCDYLRGITGSEIPPCARVKVELNAIESGDAPKPEGKIWSL